MKMVKVNFAEVEEYKPLPRGTYRFAVTDTDIKQNGESSQHPGNDYWALELTVQDGPQEGKTQFTNCMLPPYTPYDLVGILRATVGQHDLTEEEINAGEADVELEDLEGLEFIANVAPQKNNPDFNNVSRYRAVPDDWEPAGGDGSDLP
jgi:hypothetical protein